MEKETRGGSLSMIEKNKVSSDIVPGPKVI